MVFKEEVIVWNDSKFADVSEEGQSRVVDSESKLLIKSCAVLVRDLGLAMSISDLSQLS